MILFLIFIIIKYYLKYVRIHRLLKSAMNCTFGGMKYYFSNALSFDLNITKIKIIDNNQLNSLIFNDNQVEIKK